MKFANRLEALKWMCENPNRSIYFDINAVATCYKACINDSGILINSYFDNNNAHNFRTEKDEPEPKPEIDWGKIISAYPGSISVNHGHEDMLKELVSQLIPIIERMIKEGK